MRLLLILLTCVAMASCANTPAPHTEISTVNPQALSALSRFKLIAPDPILKPSATTPALYPQLTSLLREQLQQQGYQQAEPAQFHVYYWLEVREQPIELKVDQAPPNQLGAYQAIHVLHDETGTLRLRLTDPADNVLWQGTAITGLSPASYSAEQLKQAVLALTAQIPVSTAR